MRTRSRVQPGVTFGCSGGAVKCDSIPNIPIIGTFRPALFGEASPYWSDRIDTIEVMQDTTSSIRTYNAVDHTKQLAAYLRIPIEYTFSPPTPTFYGFLHGHCMYKGTLPTPTPSEWNDLVSDLAKKTSQTLHSKFMGMVTLKEMRETVTMIRNPFGLFKRGMCRKLPKGITAHTASGTKSLTNYWLEYRYGWRPLKGDVENFSKALASFIFGTQAVTTTRFWKKYNSRREIPISGLPSRVYTSSGSDKIWPMYTGSARPWTYRMVNGSSVIVRFSFKGGTHRLSLTCEKMNDGTDSQHVFDQILDVMSVRNWREIRDFLWEVMPLSFVVDWFVDFSNIWRPFDERTLCSASMRNLGYSVKSVAYAEPEVVILRPQFLEFSSTLWANAIHRISSGPVGSFSNGTQPVLRKYTRFPGLPPSSDSVFNTEGLNAFQALDLLGLILQRLPGAKH